jgi:ribose transport system ATP-binding protein
MTKAGSRHTDEESGAKKWLAVQDIAKSYGAVRALRGVSLSISGGRVHGLVGANGAGKSTLLAILGGLQQPDAGAIIMDGQDTKITSPRVARSLGLSFVHQEISLIDQFTTAANMGLGSPDFAHAGLVDRRKRRARADEIAELLKFDFPVHRQVSALSVAQRRMVSIGRALMANSRLIAMDEPSASLSSKERAALFKVIGNLADSGIAIIYVSHHLQEVVELCDMTTVMKDGSVVAELVRGSYGEKDLVRAITGSELAPDSASQTRTAAVNERDVVLSVRNLSNGRNVRSLSLELHRGEVLGIGGLVGSGRTETLRMIFGADQPVSGSMELFGKPHAPKSTYDAVRAGVALVPEERRSEGLMMLESIVSNVNVASWKKTRAGWIKVLIDKRVAARRVDEYAASLSIKMSRRTAPVHTLSGGNQQKVVMAKWLATQSFILLLDEPTHGVDVGARAELYRTVRRLADSGISFIVVSSELDELQVCDRVIVIAGGHPVGELRPPAISESAVLGMIFEDSK